MIPATISGASALQDRLLARCADGDEVAWGHLYRRHEQAARRFLLRMGVERSALEDTCQEVFLQAFRYLPRFRGDCSFQTWLYRLCVTEARRNRQKLRVSRLLGAFLTRQEEPAVTSGELGTERSERLIQEALGALSEKERIVFVLYELEGLPGREIGEVAGCPEATVWRRLHYARQVFRDYVLEREGAP